MLVREFLGWDAPFLGKAVDWLERRRDEWPRTMVVVPTAQGGRRLREALAERCGACLAPRVTTPGQWLRPAAGEVAGRAIEIAAWVEVLGGIRDWQAFDAVLPEVPEESVRADWVRGLAKTFFELRRALQENAMTFGMAAPLMASTVDAERWQQLAVLEARVEKRLSDWGLQSRNAALAKGLAATPAGVTRLVLAGVTDAPQAVLRQWRSGVAQVVALVGAPEELADDFDASGMPLAANWTGRVLPWPGDDRVEVCADPRQQAEAALRRVAAAGTKSDELALGSADEETASELVRSFGRAGWVLHDPAGGRVGGGARWLAAWRRWLARPVAGHALDLLAFPATGRISGGRRAQIARALSMARDRWLVGTGGELERSIRLARPEEGEVYQEARNGMHALEEVREAFLRDPWGQAGHAVWDAVVETEPDCGDFLDEWRRATGVVAASLRHEPGFWLELLLDEWPSASRVAPEGRVGDVQGWLELFHEPGSHLVLCGMNEGMVPASRGAEAWLSDPVRRILGLGTDEARVARDAFLFAALLESRKTGGRVDVLLSKASAGGDSLLPSRFLLGSAREELPARVFAVFREVPPPDAALPWNVDWRWSPGECVLPERINVTALRDYLACPFRYRLKHIDRLDRPDPERCEWDARDFGTVTHAVLEAWGKDEEARDFSKQDAIRDWLWKELDRIVGMRFGGHPPLAVRIQLAGMRERLGWFARAQACERADGWRIEEVERKYEWKIGEFTLVGKIDRIDVGPDGRRRIVDYKTKSRVEEVEAAHRVKVDPNKPLPEHLRGVPEVLCQGMSRGKEVTMRWVNLQLALYSTVREEVPQPCYFGIGSSDSEVRLVKWEGFRAEDRDSAAGCARWVVDRIAAKAFWPPAERLRLDDQEVLAAGKTLIETCEGGER